MERVDTKDDYTRTIKCEPLGQRENFKGSWIVGFEMSSFIDGYLDVPVKVKAGSHLYELIVPAPLSASFHAKDGAGPSAYQLSFEGRKSFLPTKSGETVVVLDRVTSVRAVPLELR